MKPLWDEPGQAKLQSLDKGLCAGANDLGPDNGGRNAGTDPSPGRKRLLARGHCEGSRAAGDTGQCEGEAARLQREQTMAAAVAEQDRAFAALRLKDRNQKNSARHWPL